MIFAIPIPRISFQSVANSLCSRSETGLSLHLIARVMHPRCREGGEVLVQEPHPHNLQTVMPYSRINHCSGKNGGQKLGSDPHSRPSSGTLRRRLWATIGCGQNPTVPVIRTSSAQYSTYC